MLGVTNFHHFGWSVRVGTRETPRTEGVKGRQSPERLIRHWLSAVYPSSMRHPNVVQTLGMEHVEGLGTCIVMEYVDGITLAYIHSLGIAHRDLKPQNIILTRQGLHVKLYKSYR